MIIDGKIITEDIRRRLMTKTKQRGAQLSLGVISLEPTPETRKFLRIKERFASSISVEMTHIELPKATTGTEQVLHEVLHAAKKYDGLVLQLPLPGRIDLDQVLSLFPLPLDVDVLGVMAYRQFKEGMLPFLPPVIGAFAEVLNLHDVVLAGKQVVIVGEGRLVGAPAAVWARRLGAFVTVVTHKSEDVDVLMRTADVIILGAGSPRMLTPSMVKDGVVILDAGTSEVGGVLYGDADPAVADKASLFTPTPGGIGPITVAKLFENLIMLDALKHEHPIFS